MENDIKKSIIEFLEPMLSKGKKVSVLNSINNDLGIVGVDAVDFFDKISNKYDVDFSKLDFEKYFSENTSIFFFKMNTNKNVTVKHLISVIERGIWFEPIT